MSILERLYQEANLDRFKKYGIYPSDIYYALTGLPKFTRDVIQYRRMQSETETDMPLNINPHFDWKREAGTASGIYFHQDLWAAQKVLNDKPNFHIDIGSRIDGFISHLLVFTSVNYVDIRPLNTNVDRLNFIQADATNLAAFRDDSISSISTLNAAEHFGLGRYGDPIDPNGSSKFMRALQRVLAPNGTLYFSVPIGVERVEFNAHRIFEPKSILDTFEELELTSFAAVINGEIDRNASPGSVELKDEGYDCGLFEFSK